MVGNGGPTVAMWAWVRALAMVGAEVTVAFDSDLSAEQPLAVAGVKCIPVKHFWRGRWRLPFGEQLHLTTDTVVVLHSAFLAGNLRVAAQARRVGAKVIFVPHGAYQHEARQRSALLKVFWLAYESTVVNRALAVHVFVEEERSSVREVASDVPLIIAPTPIGLPVGAWIGDGGYIAWFGRYDIEVKGLDLLISAYALVPEASRMPLRLRGRDSTDGRVAVQALVDNAGLGAWVSVGPAVEGDEKNDFLCNAAFFVMPSRNEAFSIALLEVLALGVPSLVSARMPIAAQLVAENACRVCDVEVPKLAKALTDVLRAPATAWQAFRPREFVARNLTEDIVGRSFLRQVSDLMESANG